MATKSSTQSATGILEFNVREARRDDMDDVLEMIQELAIFEKMPDGPKLTVEDLIRDGGYNSDTAHPLFVCFVAEEKTDIADNPNIIGYALCYYKGFSIPNGRTLYMEDLYVRPTYRCRRIGQQLFEHVQRYAAGTGCWRIDFQALRWNPAIEFYKRNGSIDLTATAGWHQFRVEGDALRALSASKEVGGKLRGNLLGYNLAFSGYSTWEGRSLQMKDLFVRSVARRCGVGRELFRAMGAHAYRSGCTRFDYHVLNWNERAVAFYKALGAVDLTEKEGWLVFRKMLA